MSAPHSPMEELDQLLDSLFVDEWDATKDARLDELVASDLALRRRYLEKMFIAGELWFALRPAAAPAKQSAPASRPGAKPASAIPVIGFFDRASSAIGRSLAWSLAVIVVLLGCYVVAISWNLFNRQPNGVNGAETSVAVIEDQKGAQWSRDPRAADGSPDKAAHDKAIERGETLRIESGVVELALAKGTKLVIEGPAEWSIDGENSAALKSGKLFAHVPSQAIGFTLVTPTAEIVDLGTEFGVSTTPTGETEIQVIRGAVRATQRVKGVISAKTKPWRLEAGSTVRIVSDPDVPIVAIADAGPIYDELRARQDDASYAGTSLERGGNITGGWSHGNPALGKDGIIASDGVYGGVAQNFAQAGPGEVRISQTAGDLAPIGNASFAPHNSGSAVYYWNVSGGSIQTPTNFVATERVHMILSGSGLLKHTGPSDLHNLGYLAPVNESTFKQTGGTLQGFTIICNNGSTMTLNGGVGREIGKGWPSQAALWVSNDYTIAAYGENSTMKIAGRHAITFDANVSPENLVITESKPPHARGKLIFDPAWSGSWTCDNFTKADWITALTDEGVLVGAVQVTAENFDRLFQVSKAGAVGSSVRLVAVPKTN